MLRLLKKILDCTDEVDDGVRTQILNCFKWHPSTEAEKYIKKMGLRLSNDLITPTARNYRELARMLKGNGINLIAMQYPTLPLANLRNYFEDQQKNQEQEFKFIKFVSNEDNFRKALREHPYDFLFTDRFAFNWGHTTSEGHRLIAESALNAVLEIISEDKRNPAAQD